MTNRELDALVAEKIFGPVDFTIADVTGEYGVEILRFSTDISAAWQVVEKMIETHNDLFVVFSGGIWSVTNHDTHIEGFCGSSFDCFSADGEDLPRVICLAALKAMGVDVEMEKVNG